MVKHFIIKTAEVQEQTVVQCKAKDSWNKKPCWMIQVDLLWILTKGIPQVKAICVSERIQSRMQGSKAKDGQATTKSASEKIQSALSPTAEPLVCSPC